MAYLEGEIEAFGKTYQEIGSSPIQEPNPQNKRQYHQKAECCTDHGRYKKANHVLDPPHDQGDGEEYRSRNAYYQPGHEGDGNHSENLSHNRTLPGWDNPDSQSP